MKLSLKGIVKRFDQAVIVNGVDLEIAEGEMFFLLGPSGCGKTTILRMIAGFYDPDAGEIFFNEKRMNGVAPQERNTALVFQNYAVWPHLTVFENVAYGLRVRKLPEAEIQQRTKDALQLVKMQQYQDRKPTSLSGGQQQRVALARAVVVNPDLLLFDEPLSNLDAKLRLEMREEFKRLHARTRITSIYVTHDQEEALSLATRIAVMNAGRIQQVGTPQEIYNHPVNRFVAEFIGEMNFLDAASPLAKMLVSSSSPQIGFRPEHVIVKRADEAAAALEKSVQARVILSTYLGSKNQLILKLSSGEEIKAWSAEYFQEGAELDVSVQPGKLHAFEA